MLIMFIYKLRGWCAAVYRYEKQKGSHSMNKITQVASIMSKKQQTLSSAESCTGGLIAKLCTDLSGSSQWYMGGVISYSNQVKAEVLNVPMADIEAHGAVSEPVVKAMVKGVQTAMHTDFALATTGVAGPGGGSADKPVGTVWLGLATPHTVLACLKHFDGDRAAVREQAARFALAWLLEHVG